MDLGFLEQCESLWLSNRYFPSKVGGKPAWLELEKLPKDLLCKTCGSAQTFLCQIYAPFGDEENFHRTVYVFICRSKDCQQPNASNHITVFRTQLAKKNPFYSEDPPLEDGDPLLSIPALRKLCLVCGCIGPYSCGRCKNVNYCTSVHQKAHWPIHKINCNVERKPTELELATTPLPDLLFPEYEIVIEETASTTVEKMEEDDDDAADDDEASEVRRLEEFQRLEAAGKTGELKDIPLSELDKYAGSSASIDDKHFRKFQNEVKKEPDQVIRYKCSGAPLWIADPEKTIKQQLIVPLCEHCGGEREFEFQIMPQLLVSLKDEQLDWGVLAIYTCAKSCSLPADVGYVEEYVIKQDVLSDMAKT